MLTRALGRLGNRLGRSSRIVGRRRRRCTHSAPGEPGALAGGGGIGWSSCLLVYEISI